MSQILPEHVAELEIFFKDQAPRTFNYARKLTAGDVDLANDLMMDAAEAAARNWATLRTQPVEIQALWLCTVVRRWHIDRLRRTRTARDKLDELTLRDQASEAKPEDLVGLRLMVDAFNEAITRMPTQRQRAARYKWHCGMTNTEIALELDITPGAVSAHVTAARAALRQVLDAHQSSDPDGMEGGAHA